MDMDKKNNVPRNSDMDTSVNDPFLQQILDAMDQEERNKLSPERTERMLRKIHFAASLNHIDRDTKPPIKKASVISKKEPSGIKQEYR